MDAAGKYEGLIVRIIQDVRPYTVVPDKGLEATIIQTLEACERGVPGVLVECGVWRGGSSFAMLLAQKYAFGAISKPIWMYDSFEGMGEPCATDGQHAEWWHTRSKNSSVDPDGVNFCIASIDEVKAGAEALGLTDYVILQKGWYHDTLFDARPGEIAVLRIDCDWYEPCELVYRMLEPLVSEGGVIIADDYGIWEGCTLATHEYLAERKLPWPIQSVPGHGMYMVKGAPTW